MRTSYRMNHDENSDSVKEPPTIEENLEREADKIIEEDKRTKEERLSHTYYEIMNEKYESNDKDSINEAVSNVEDEAKEEKEKSKKSRKKIWITLLSVFGVLIIIAGSLFIYSKYIKQDNSVEAISQRVDSLYTSPQKVDIKSGVTVNDLDKYYIDLNEAETKGEDISAVSEELDTIGYFLSDKETLSEYDNEDYDLTTSGLQDSINNIKKNSEIYSVPGLAVTISDLCTKVNNDYEEFISLRSELQSVTDVISFDEEGYKSKIATISHKPNQEELTAIYNNIVADKQAAEAEQALKDAATQEAQEKAQQALEEAQKMQQETQEKLENAEKELQEKADTVTDSAGDVLDSIKGTITGDNSEESSSSESSANESAK